MRWNQDYNMEKKNMQNTYSIWDELSSCQVPCSCAKTWNQGVIPFFSSPSHMNSLSCRTLLVLGSLFCISSLLFFFILLNYLCFWMLMLVAKEKEFTATLELHIGQKGDILLETNASLKELLETGSALRSLSES